MGLIKKREEYHSLQLAILAKGKEMNEIRSEINELKSRSMKLRKQFMNVANERESLRDDRRLSCTKYYILIDNSARTFYDVFESPVSFVATSASQIKKTVNGILPFGVFSERCAAYVKEDIGDKFYDVDFEGTVVNVVTDKHGEYIVIDAG